jgi:hypothetical protein
MRERFIKVRDIVYWIDVDHISFGKPVYKVARGYYLCSYEFGSEIKHICTGSVTSCVVRHVPDGFVFTSEAKANKMLEKMNNESMESN